MASVETTLDQVNILFPFMVIRNCFSVANKKGNTYISEQFYNCREVFHDDFPRFNNILISTQKYKCKRLVSLFDLIETKLNLKERSKIYLTQRKNVFFISLSNFWNNNIRFSLLTLLIRSGLKIKYLNCLQDLLSHNTYLRQTENAFNLFMDGFTKYYGNNISWYKQFQELDTDSCMKILHKK